MNDNYGYAPQLFFSILLNVLLIAYFFNSSHDSSVMGSSKIVIGHAVYQCEKKQELDLK
jgi:hypothetical protein